MIGLGKNRKAEVTVFLILALLILLGGALIIHYLDLEPSKINPADPGQVKRDSIYSFMQSCLEYTTINAVAQYGLQPGTSEILISRYIEKKFPLCTDDFKIFEDEQFTITRGSIKCTVNITDEALIVNLIYPLGFAKDNSVISFDKDTYVLQRKKMMQLNPSSETTIVSDNEKAQFIIPAGTEARLDGGIIHQVGIELLDRNYEGHSNSVLAGMVAIRGLPDDVQFSQPITIVYQYNQFDVPSTIDENDLRLAFYSEILGVWIAIPTTVDPVNNILMAHVTHFTDFGMVIRCTPSDLTEHITQMLVQEDCQTCENWKTDTPPEGVGPLWSQSDTVTTGNKIGDTVPTCKQTLVNMATPANPEPIEKSYYSYDTINIEGMNSLAYTKYANQGDSCIWATNGNTDPSPKILIKDTANPTPGTDWDILLNATCKDETDQCLIPENTYSFADSTLKYTLKVINGEADPANACIKGRIILRYSGFGISKNEGESYYVCAKDEETDEKQMPFVGGTPTQSILSTCTCGPDYEGKEVCKWVPKADAQVIDDPLIDRAAAAGATGDMKECPPDVKEKYMGVTFTYKGASNLDTRSSVDFSDAYGDFPIMQWDPSLQCEFTRNTPLKVFGSAFAENTCWLLVEAQKYVAAREEMPDFYVRLNDVQASIEGTATQTAGQAPACKKAGAESGGSGTSGSPVPGTGGSGHYVGGAPKCGESNPAEGIDTSHWEIVNDWNKVKASGISFVITKASEGNTYTDDTFARYWKGMQAAGLIRGAYHWISPDVDGKTQADYFLAVIGGANYDGEIPPVVDLEESGVTPSQLKAFLDEVERVTGRVPMIYTGIGYWWDFGGGDEFARYPLWVANWEVDCPNMPATWDNWVFWQWCGDCQKVIPGIPDTSLDLDVFNGDENALMAYVNSQK